MSTVERTPAFDLSVYLDGQDNNPNFQMVEIGHGRHPVAYRQPVDFIDGRSYVGVDAGLRDLSGSQPADLEKMRAEHPEQDVIFMEQGVGKNGEMRRRSLFSTIGTITYFGPYNARTALEAGSADEVFLSNVFGDQHVVLSRRRSQALLDETSRLAADNGLVIIRETTTPHLAYWRLNDKLLEEAGLTMVGMTTQHDSTEWGQLEERYGNNWGALSRHRNFYMFLAKRAFGQDRS